MKRNVSYVGTRLLDLQNLRRTGSTEAHPIMLVSGGCHLVNVQGDKVGDWKLWLG